MSAELKRVLKFVCPGVKASLDWLGSRTVAAHPAFVPPYTKHSSGQQLNHAAYVEKCVTYVRTAGIGVWTVARVQLNAAVCLVHTQRERIHSSVHGLRRALMDRPGDVSVQRDAAVVTRHDVTVPWLVEDRFQAWPDSRSEQHGSVELEWVLPPSVAETGYRPPHVVLFLHGGGYVVGSPEMYRNLTAELAIATNAAVCVPRYRLAPSHPFPAALEDALAAYWTIMAHGTTPSQLAIAGDSGTYWWLGCCCFTPLTCIVHSGWQPGGVPAACPRGWRCSAKAGRSGGGTALALARPGGTGQFRGCQCPCRASAAATPRGSCRPGADALAR